MIFNFFDDTKLSRIFGIDFNIICIHLFSPILWGSSHYRLLFIGHHIFCKTEKRLEQTDAVSEGRINIPV